MSPAELRLLAWHWDWTLGHVVHGKRNMANALCVRIMCTMLLCPAQGSPDPAFRQQHSCGCQTILPGLRSFRRGMAAVSGHHPY